jgi:hypothetical protein
MTAHASPKLAAVAPDPTGTSVAHAFLVGPGGQLYAPVADRGGWARTTAAGIATPITAAAASGGEIHAAGASAPPFRWRTGEWAAEPLPARGALVLGSGPALAAAIGDAIFVRTDAQTWTQVATAPSAPAALWAASATQVWIVAGGAAWRLRGKSFTRGPDATALAAGPRPIAIAAGAAIDLSANRTVHPSSAGDVVAAAPAGAEVALLVKDAHGVLAVERHPAKGAATTAPAPAGIAWAWMWADAHGAIALAAPTGEVTVLDGGAWHDAQLEDVAAAAPAAHAGPGPAISR